MTKKKAPWVAVPVELLTSTTSAGVVVWAFLKSRCNPKRDKGHYVTWVSLPVICNGTLLSRVTVIKALDYLQEWKWIYRYSRLTDDRRAFIEDCIAPWSTELGKVRGRSNVYVICPMERANFFDHHDPEK